MIGFQSKIAEVLTTDGRNFKLLKSITYISEAGITYIMPAGAPSDGASTPAILWPKIPPFGDYWLAAYLHDCAYQNTLQLSDGTKAKLLKSQCDDLLKEAMLSLGVDKVMVDTIYEGVVLGGWEAFKDDRS